MKRSLKASGLSRRDDARTPSDVGVPRSLARYGLIATIVVFVVAAALVTAFAKRHAQQAAQAQVAHDAAVVGREYALARASLPLALARWSNALSKTQPGPQALDAGFHSLALNPGDWLVLTDGGEEATAARGIAPGDWDRLAHAPDRFVQIGAATYILGSVDLTDGHTLYAALNLTSRVGPLTVTHQPPPVADTHRLTLDQTADQTLSVALGAPRGVAQNQRALWLLAPICVLLACALTWLWRILLRRSMNGYWQRELAPLVQAIDRVRQGNCAQPMRTNSDHPLTAIALEFNAMQNEIDDRQSRMDYQSQFDALTGLMTRAMANDRISRAVDRATIANQTMAAVAIDVTRFNEINGTLGQDVGDMVLKELARRLSANTRVSDTVARVGGDEFMLLLDDVDEKTAVQLVEFLVATLETPIVVRDTSIKLKIRAGLALFPDHAEGARALRRMANIALMTAKETQSKVLMYEPGQDEKQLRELAIIHDLPAALREGELYLQYQPKIEVETQCVETVEALVRWRHPQLGFIPPDEFIGLLEKAGQIGQLTDWVFKAAIRQLREWNTAGYDLGVAVNISACDLRDASLPDRIAALLHHYTVKPARLSIEVTESAVIDDPERAVSVLQAFRKIGLKIALDDFGTGQTSLSLLKQLPLSQVKIDKSFVQHLRADSGDAIIVKSIIDLGHNMGLRVTAEGVESNYCWNLLKSYQCDLVQGYLVSAPLTADELCQWYLRLQDRHVNKLDYSFLQNAG